MSAPSTELAPPSAELAQWESRLLAVLGSVRRPGVAFSGGVDSTVVAAAAQRVHGAAAMAFTAVGPSLPEGEAAAAADLARQIGIRHQFVTTHELNRPDYVRNSSQRCFHCKTELYERLLDVAPSLGVDVLLNGANVDDLGDHRPGMQAARDFEVRSPLIEAGCGKEQVRLLARAWQLPNADKPAGPCLASRLAYGVSVTPERLHRIDAAERWLRRRLDLGELRVRLEERDLARIELPPATIPRLAEPSLCEEIVSHFRGLGFRYITLDLAGFRSGSMNEVLVPLQLSAGPLP